MPIYKLSPDPDELEHRNWAASIYKGVCHVSAANENEARRFADMAFHIATYRDGGTVRTSPWGHSDLVSCVEVAHMAGDPPPHGMVLTPDGTYDFNALDPRRQP